MGKFKIYAVKKGRKTGIFYTWPECEAQVKNYENPIFKGFQSEEEALIWLVKGGTPVGAKKKTTEEVPNKENFNAETYFLEDHLDTNVLPPEMPKNYAFVDGSFNEHCNGKAVYGFGGIVHVNGEDVYISGNGCEAEFVSSRQIPGEVFGSIAAIRKAIELGAEHLVIFYDYAGIGHWATSGKRWKAEKPIAKEYVRLYDELSQKIKVNFYHVKAHTGIQGNEQVDDMAKREVGLV